MRTFYYCLLRLVAERILPANELTNIHFQTFLERDIYETPSASITWDYRNGKFGLDYKVKDKEEIRIVFKRYGDTWYIWGKYMRNDPNATKDKILFRGINRYIDAHK